MNDLRKRVEAVLAQNPDATPTASTRDVQKLVHDLWVHQGELEAQNEELRQAQLEWSESRDRYAEMLDIAPVGYLTLDREGRILESNLTAATMLGAEREGLIRQQNLSHFIAREAREEWILHHRAVLASKGRQTCKLAMYRQDGAPFLVRLESVVLPEPKEGGPRRRVAVAISDITESEALRKSEERLRIVCENVPDPVFLKDGESRIVMANPATLRAIGKPAEEVLGKNDAEFYAGWIADAILETDRRIMERGESEVIEETIETPQGNRVYLSTKAPWRDAEGRVVGIMGIARDITERKQAEEEVRRLNQELEQRVQQRTAELRESESRFRAIFENASDGIILADPETRKFSFANRAACQLLGYSEEEITTLALPDIHPEEAVPYVTDQFDRQERGEFTLAKDIPVKRKDGTVLYADVNAFPTHVAGKRYLAGIFRDITERKQAEEALRESEDRFRTIFECAPDAYYLNDLKGRFIDGNRTAENLIGYKREELIGKSLLELNLLPKSQIRKAAARLAQNALGHSAGPDEFVLKRKDGSKVDVEIRAYPVTLKDERVVLGIARDITMRKKTERRLRSLTARFMNAEEDARRQLSRELHDDVNQRLAMLSVDLDSAAQNLPVTDVNLRPVLADIKIRLDKLSDDIDNLAHKFHPAALEELGLADALESYAHKLAKLRPFSFVVKERNLPAHLPQSIATCLYRVGQEALLNAVKHSQSEQVGVRLVGTVKVAMISVRDYGTGFDRTLARKKSARLGLIHMEERVKLMGGRLLIRSSPGRGTLVRAWIPLEGSRS